MLCCAFCAVLCALCCAVLCTALCYAVLYTALCYAAVTLLCAAVLCAPALLLVKEEPAGWFPDTEEGLENLQYTEADTSLGYGGQQATYQGGCLPWELAAVASQAHTLDAHLPQGIPGPSRIQGVEDVGRLTEGKCPRAYKRWNTEERLQIHRACTEMGPSKAARQLSQRFGRKINESTVRSIHKSYIIGL
ncbi:putative Broad-complex core protein-like 11 [Homarus americanus]|uniref:Putative Broad-complex core protein-like 11 n=1 Tax=Homarus americanus TaxID=6706 RepID=A0A8J5NC57_HOMAM|nr:putative Broad-complex core protein-like 11 [Homarus americanus]